MVRLVFTPPLFAEEDPAVILELVRSAGFGHLVCTDAAAIVSSPLPFVIDDSLASVRAHVARPNSIWRLAPCRALLIVPVADAYISPGWYPSKADHGKVVPTWNYEVVHLHGRLVAHDNGDWLRSQVESLTERNEIDRPEPWSVSDAPDQFVTKQIQAIVGLELLVDGVEAKRKLSQNRAPADYDGAIEGLRSVGPTASDVADAMDRSRQAGTSPGPKS